MSVQHQGPCAVSIRELWQQIEEMKATIAELKTTLRDDRVSVNEQIDTVVDELEREGRRRVSLSSRLSKQASSTDHERVPRDPTHAVCPSPSVAALL